MKLFVFLVSVFFLLFSTTTTAKSSLVGTNTSQIRQTERSMEENLPVVQSDLKLEELKSDGVLVPIPKMVRVDYRLEEKWRWCLPQVTFFLGDVGLEFQEVFNKKLQVNSAVRTVHRQLELMKINNNAVPPVGPKRSSHITGATVDIAKIGLSEQELEWVRTKLLILEDEDRVEATEENDQLVFHVMIFRSYQD